MATAARCWACQPKKNREKKASTMTDLKRFACRLQGHRSRECAWTLYVSCKDGERCGARTAFVNAGDPVYCIVWSSCWRRVGMAAIHRDPGKSDAQENRVCGGMGRAYRRGKVSYLTEREGTEKKTDLPTRMLRKPDRAMGRCGYNVRQT